jgi:hypothetical protein
MKAMIRVISVGFLAVVLGRNSPTFSPSFNDSTCTAGRGRPCDPTKTDPVQYAAPLASFGRPVR